MAFHYLFFYFLPSSFLFISGCGATGWREADANSKREVDLNQPAAAVNLDNKSSTKQKHKFRIFISECFRSVARLLKSNLCARKSSLFFLFHYPAKKE